MAKRAATRPAKAERQPSSKQANSGVRPPLSAVVAEPHPASPAPAAEALLAFQRAMEAMQRHAFADAIRAFQVVLMGFPGERALVERSTVYLALCERELNRKPAAPKTIEERLTAATAALNNGDDPAAEELARSVLGDDPRHDLALYLLAAVHARRDDRDEAISLLGKVLAITPEASAQARADADFDSLHEIEAFWTMTEPHGAPARIASPPASARRAVR